MALALSVRHGYFLLVARTWKSIQGKRNKKKERSGQKRLMEKVVFSVESEARWRNEPRQPRPLDSRVGSLVM